jgi:hypothetical protein
LIFHFEILGATGWESFGSGVGSGERPTETAIADLRSICGGRLPDGSYRFIAASSSESVWHRIDVRNGGTVGSNDA